MYKKHGFMSHKTATLVLFFGHVCKKFIDLCDTYTYTYTYTHAYGQVQA